MTLAGAASCARSVPTPSSSRITGRDGARANLLTHRTLDPRSKIPEYKVSACRIEKADGAGRPRGAAARRDRLAPGSEAADAEGRLMHGYEFFVDPSRCIGCRACVTACAECDTHRGVSMIHVDYIDRAEHASPPSPTVCMHCDEPTCALVCPADAIKKGEDGVVQSR